MKKHVVLLATMAMFILLIGGCKTVPPPVKINTGQYPQSFETVIDGSTRAVNYLLYIPKEYPESRKDCPLILFLHGAGERGNDISMVAKHGPSKLVAEEKKELPFIIASPQCPASGWWSTPLQTELLSALLEDLVSRYRIDKERIYVTGLSMGGFGTWALAAAFPERFAAIAPICGGGNPGSAAKIAHLPAWVFHGGKDEVVQVRQSEQMVAALEEAGGNPRFTVYPEAGHDSWTQTYSNPYLYEWFLMHKRSGILDEGVATERSMDLVEILMSDDWLRVGSMVVDTDRFTNGAVGLVAANPADVPLMVRGTVKGDSRLEISTAEIDLTVPARAEARVEIEVSSAEPVELSALDPLEATISGSYATTARLPVVFEGTHVIDMHYDWQGPELTRNGRFAQGMAGWNAFPRSAESGNKAGVVSGELIALVRSADPVWALLAFQPVGVLQVDTLYRLSFRARTDHPSGASVSVSISDGLKEEGNTPIQVDGQPPQDSLPVGLSPEMTPYEMDFRIQSESDLESAVLVFAFAQPGEVAIDDVSLRTVERRD